MEVDPGEWLTPAALVPDLLQLIFSQRAEQSMVSEISEFLQKEWIQPINELHSSSSNNLTNKERGLVLEIEERMKGEQRELMKKQLL